MQLAGGAPYAEADSNQHADGVGNVACSLHKEHLLPTETERTTLEQK